MFRRRPVNTTAFGNHISACFDNPQQLAVQRHTIRRGCHAGTNLPQFIELDGGFATPVLAMRGDHARPAALKPVSLVRQIIGARIKLGIKIGNAIGNNLLRGFLIVNALINQPLGIKITG